MIVQRVLDRAYGHDSPHIVERRRIQAAVELPVQDPGDRVTVARMGGVAVAKLARPLVFELGEHQRPVLAGIDAPARLGGLALRGLGRTREQCLDRDKRHRQRVPSDPARGRPPPAAPAAPPAAAWRWPGAGRRPRSAC